MGIRDVIDAHVTPHGAWPGASVGPLVSLWLGYSLAERAHRLVAERDWVAERTETCNTMRAMTLRDTDGTDERWANVRLMLGDEMTQARLEGAMLRQWRRVYRLPTETRRLDRTSVSVYHDATTGESLLQQGHSTDHRPAWRQFTALLAPRAPLGLPLVYQPVAGHRADDGLDIPASEAATTALGTAAVVVIGASTMGPLATRGHLVAGGSGSLCASRPPSATAERATGREQALARSAAWQGLEKVAAKTGEVRSEVMIDAWEHAHSWTPPVTQPPHTWTERGRVVRSAA
jgi:hypothetical protein